MPDCLQTYQERPWIDRPCTGKPGIFWRLNTKYKTRITMYKSPTGKPGILWGLQRAECWGNRGGRALARRGDRLELGQQQYGELPALPPSCLTLVCLPGLPQWDGSWWRKVCSRKGCGELKTAILSSWRKKHCTFPGSRARSVFKLGGEDCGPRERLLGAPPLHRGHPDAAISLTWSSSWSWLWSPCWYMVLRLHGLRACYRYM